MQTDSLGVLGNRCRAVHMLAKHPIAEYFQVHVLGRYLKESPETASIKLARGPCSVGSTIPRNRGPECVLFLFIIYSILSACLPEDGIRLKMVVSYHTS